jgi:hypothetical protein
MYVCKEKSMSNTRPPEGDDDSVVVPFRANPANPEFQEYLVKRDKAQPFEFAGVRLAHASDRGFGGMLGHVVVGAVYRTRGGKYITSLSKSSYLEMMNAEQASVYNKAEVHDTFEAAMDWFRPGRVTDEIRNQLGLDKPLRIE